VHVIKSLETDTGIPFFDRSLIAFSQQGKVALYPMTRLKDEFANGALTPDTLTFNNLVATKNEWQNGWLKPAKDTWLARYLPKSVVAS